MIIGFEESDIRRWKSDLISYQKGKKSGVNQSSQKTQLFPRSQLKPQTSMSTYTKQVIVQPKLIAKQPLQRTEKSQASLQKGIRYKYDKPYDIINNHSFVESNLGQANESHLKNMAPVRNLYNLINGQKIPDSLLKNRVVILPPFYNKKKVDKPKDADILHLQQNGIQKVRSNEISISKQLIGKKMSQNPVYDKIYNRYYNSQDEDKYWKEKKEKQIERTKQNFEDKLPKSYQVRERYIQDFTKPLPEGVVQFAEKTKNLKKHKKLRYIMQERQKIRGQVQYQRQSNILQVKRDRKISKDNNLFPLIQLNP